MTDTPDLVARLRLLEAWRKPAGPTPKDKMPNTYKTVKEAADRIEALQKACDAKGDLIGQAYQVVGALSDPWGDDPAVIMALDVLAAGEGSMLPFVPQTDPSGEIEALRTHAEAMAVCLRDMHSAVIGKPVGGGEGMTFTLGYPSAEQLNRANAALAAYRSAFPEER